MLMWFQKRGTRQWTKIELLPLENRNCPFTELPSTVIILLSKIDGERGFMQVSQMLGQLFHFFFVCLEEHKQQCSNLCLTLWSEITPGIAPRTYGTWYGTRVFCVQGKLLTFYATLCSFKPICCFSLLGPHLVVLRAYEWLCIHRSHSC